MFLIEHGGVFLYSFARDFTSFLSCSEHFWPIQVLRLFAFVKQHTLLQKLSLKLWVIVKLVGAIVEFV